MAYRSPRGIGSPAERADARDGAVVRPVHHVRGRVREPPAKRVTGYRGARLPRDVFVVGRDEVQGPARDHRRGIRRVVRLYDGVVPETRRGKAVAVQVRVAATTRSRRRLGAALAGQRKMGLVLIGIAVGGRARIGKSSRRRAKTREKRGSVPTHDSCHGGDPRWQGVT